MNIGEQIKQRRTEKGMTQEELAKLLNVARSTISNWEINRNYPDIETIVLISDVLDVSLDQLLRGDKQMIKQLSDDTKDRKKLSLKVKLLYVVIGLLIAVGGPLTYVNSKSVTISKASQIVSVEIIEGELHILTDLPVYRSVTSYMMGNSFEDDSVIEIQIGSSIDLSMKHTEELTTVKNSDLFNETVKQLKVVDGNNDEVKTFDINPKTKK